MDPKAYLAECMLPEKRSSAADGRFLVGRSPLEALAIGWPP